MKNCYWPMGFVLKIICKIRLRWKIKMPEEKIKAIEEYGIKLPTIDDYTNSVVANDAPLYCRNKASRWRFVLY